jgi:hypothetical protein
MRGYVLAAVLSLTSSAVLAQTPLPERLKALQSDPAALKACGRRRKKGHFLLCKLPR